MIVARFSMREDFAIFIITHGHPDKQITYNTLLSCGYSGKIYFVIDNTDVTIQQYIDNYGKDSIIVFDKNYYINSERFDNGTNTPIYACAIYARRAVEDIAKSMKLTYFAMADDDIKTMVIRYPINNKLKRVPITDMNKIIDAHLELLDVEPLACIGFGGVQNYFSGASVFSALSSTKPIIPYQFFLRKTAKPVRWSCWYGEDDVEAYFNTITGNMWFASLYVMIESMPNGTGSMATTYATINSYVMSFAELRYFPGLLRVHKRPKSKASLFGVVRKNSDWFPRILNKKYKIKENCNVTD